MKIIAKIVIATIFIGVIALAFNIAFGNQTITYVEKVRYNEFGSVFYYYKFNFTEYIQNIEMSITDTSTLTLALPTRTWKQMTDILNWEPLGNDLALILDYVILGLNVLGYPFRIGAYLVKNLLVILGVNRNTADINNGLAWLINLLNWFISSFQIPYV